MKNFKDYKINFFSLQFIKYLIAGGSSYIIYTVLLVIGVELLNIKDYLSNILSNGIAFFYSFYISKNWVFVNKQNSSKSFLRYFVLGLISYLINISGFTLIQYIFDIYYLITQVIMVLFVALINYSVLKRWVFN